MKRNLFSTLMLTALMTGQAQAITTINAHNTQAVLEATEGNAIILFSKSACRYCSYIKPLFNQLANAFEQLGIKFIIVDITSNQSFYRSRFNISTVPTVIYYKNGNVVSRHGSNNGKMKLATMKGFAQRICA